MIEKLVVSLLAFGAMLLLTLLVAMIIGWPLMILWNAIVPGVFVGVKAIGFWDAVGLIFMVRLLLPSTSTSSK